MRWVGVGLLGAFAVGLFIASFVLTRNASDFQAHAVSVSGVISGHEEDRCSGKDRNKRRYQYTCFKYRVRYETEGGSRESVVDQTRSDRPDRLGEQVELRLDPRTQTVFFAGAGPWTGPIVTALFGLLCLGGAFLFFKLTDPERR
ncbi:DUF3592 domain-containing protein [Corallococcus sp. ZKHCc1 1396]|uniref:DUF3592 domain-containing protein n=1 Tax=Corallococcus soli TaxID=2710757 RepID=A0ABR9PMZ0_9BACT|nr:MULTISPECIES: DUF3592 domain-containing protein [Corallococcus]MBE4749271.1 DUF3592 domain-containing protein [Corallococcus soli]MCY1034876.1 DUF3592 domain-containing protein [Corallococcus sp. BB11-1]